MESLQAGEERAVALIGAGAVGSALARRLAERGYSVQAVISRTEVRAAALAEQVAAPVASGTPDEPGLLANVHAIFCCVPDDVLAGLVRQLRTLPLDWTGRLVAHTSGALTTRVLVPLAEAGAHTLSFHPMQTFLAGTPPEAFEGIYVGLEGSPEAVARGRRLATELGCRTVELTRDAKSRYHLAASMASNFFVALMALVGEVLASAGIERAEGAALMRPLVETTCRNLKGRLPEEALTGPIVRGDRTSVAEHAAALTAHLPHLVPVYATLATETIRLSVSSGKIELEKAEELLDVLHAALEPYDASPL